MPAVTGYIETIRPRSAPQPFGAFLFGGRGIIFMATAAITFERVTFAASVARRLESLNAGQEFFSDYISLTGRGLSQPELSKIVNGVRTPDAERVKQIETALHELEELNELFVVLPIRLDDAEQIRDLVRACVHQPETMKKINEAVAAGFLSAGDKDERL